MIREEGVRLQFSYAAGRAGSASLKSLAEGRLVGIRCDHCGQVAFPGSGICPVCGNEAAETVLLEPGGIVEAVTDVPGKGRFGLIHLVGADVPTIQRLLGVTVVGDTVEPVFGPDSEHPLEGFRASDATSNRETGH